MTPFDMTVLAVLGLCFVYSVFRGLVKEVFSLLAVVGGFLLALKFQDQLGHMLEAQVKQPELASALGFGLVFMAALVGITLVGKLVRSLLQLAPGFSTADRLLGGAVGLLKGIILLLIAFYPLNFFPDLGKKWTKDSFFAPYIREASSFVGQNIGNTDFLSDVPAKAYDKVKEGLDKVKDVGKMTKDLKWKGADEVDKQGEGDKTSRAEPQDNLTPEDRKQLQKILIKLDKEN